MNKRLFFVLFAAFLLLGCQATESNDEIAEQAAAIALETMQSISMDSTAASMPTEMLVEPTLTQPPVATQDQAEKFDPVAHIQIDLETVALKQAENELVMNVNICWDVAEWTAVQFFGPVYGFDAGETSKAVLRDGNGKAYPISVNLMEMPAQDANSACIPTILVVSDFVAEEASELLTLEIYELSISSRYDERVTLSLGDGIQVGESIPLEITFVSGGFEIVARSVTATDEIYSSGGGGGGGGSAKSENYALLFDLQKEYPMANGSYEVHQTLFNDQTSENFVNGDGNFLPGETGGLLNSMTYDGMPSGDIEIGLGLYSLKLFSTWAIEFQLNE